MECFSSMICSTVAMSVGIFAFVYTVKEIKCDDDIDNPTAVLLTALAAAFSATLINSAFVNAGLILWRWA